MMRKLAVAGMMLLLWGCKVNPETEIAAAGVSETNLFSAVVWNVQALFDGMDTGIEYDEYRTESGWTVEKYQARIESVSGGIMKISPVAPDLIGLLEVENAKVLTDLAQGELSTCNYKYSSFANIPGSSLGLGVLSRHPLVYSAVHSITAGKETIPRPVLEVRLMVRGKFMVFFLCHWKSKLGSENATEALRRAAARVIRRRLNELHGTEPGLPVIVMGDLNENYDEFYRRKGEVVTAILPDDQKAAKLVESGAAQVSDLDFIVISGNKPPKAANFDVPVTLYSPWGNELQNGSYYYKSAWETIDHLLLSPGLFDQEGWEFDSCRVVNDVPFTGATGKPSTYNPRSGNGLSDHLPLYLLLRDNGP